MDEYLDMMLKAARATVFSDFIHKGGKCLGETIELLSECNPDAIVKTSDGNIPDELDSYRGYYNHLSIECGGEEKLGTVKSLLARLQEAIGETFTGYKGGEFTMGKFTPLWCAVYSTCGPALVGIEDNGDNVILLLEYINKSF